MELNVTHLYNIPHITDHWRKVVCAYQINVNK